MSTPRDIARVRAYGSALALTSDLDIACGHARDRDLDVVLGLHLGHAHDRALDLVRTLGLEPTHSLSLDFALDHVRAVDTALTRALDSASHFDLDLMRLRSTAWNVQLQIDGLRNPVVAQGVGDDSNGIVVAKASSRLTAWAARLVPPMFRGEFEEEFRSELYEVAAGGAGWWAQVRHCLRVLVRAPLLRRELLAPAPSVRERPW